MVIPYHPPESPAHLADYLPPRSWILLIEPGELESEGRQYLERFDRPQGFHGVADVFRRFVQFPSITASAIATGSLETTCRLPIESVERFSGHIDKVRDEFDDAGRGQQVFLICQTEAEVRRLSEVFGGTQLANDGRLHFSLGTLQSGFRLVPESHRSARQRVASFFRRADVQRPAAVHRRLGRAIDSFLDLHDGDLVVHLSHGIARYRGMKLHGEERAGRGASGTGVSRQDEALRAGFEESAWCRNTWAASRAGPCSPGSGDACGRRRSVASKRP